MVVIPCSMKTLAGAARAQPGDHLRVAVVEEELHAGFQRGDGVHLGLGELKVEDVDVLRRPMRTSPPTGGVRQPHGTKTLTGDTGEVHPVAVSPDGTWLAASSMDREERPWDRC